MIELDGVSKRFGAVEALRNVQLQVQRGEWLGLFGHNGSGKTTLIRILLGISAPTSGKLLIDGQPPQGDHWLDFRRRLGFMPERVAFYENLTGTETLRYFARLRGVGTDTVPPMLERVGLAEAAGRRVGGYSKGMRQRLNLAQALLGDPLVLVLDEPLEGLDPQGVRDLFDQLRSGSPRTVVFASHRLPEVCNEADRVCLLDRGEIKALGTVEELTESRQRPIRVHIYPANGLNGDLEAILDRLGAQSPSKRGERLTVEVPQSNKVDFLASLKGHSQAIRHLRIEEPGLEEVYFDEP